jgi:hypothetical protein
MEQADVIIGDCFNDLKRSTLMIKVLNMKRAGILKPEQVQNLSPAGQDLIRSVESHLKKSEPMPHTRQARLQDAP